ncbi:TIGR03564 family F420-dependent LLM class oxidoreductase [Actinomadura atramentaria]|uniref:TIGR03564 family F420-dependent LLM class oxidoreductase n=1 Tax=Actinomadura atramentaria TaxID=1990 RepID=UPI00037F91B4|nr:TIGR03564 family F420-dependent LLM class oxidoreductase [Actinomadura atramentaria]
MRIGVFLLAGGAPLDTIADQARHAAGLGYASAFFGQLTGWDAIAVAAEAARRAPGLEVGTAVVHTYAQHPVGLAGRALTASALTGGRFTLGVGPSHPGFVQDLYGASYERPARHVREYLTVLRPLLAGEEVEYQGATLSTKAQVSAPGAAVPPIILSALGPVMLKIAGELADGVVTTWTGAAALADHIVPSAARAAEAAGRPAPRVLAGISVALTDDPDGVRAELGAQLGFAGNLPAYRAILDRQGLDGVHETLLAGDEKTLERDLARFADAGVTDLLVSAHGDDELRERTLAFVADRFAQPGVTNPVS